MFGLLRLARLALGLIVLAPNLAWADAADLWIKACTDERSSVEELRRGFLAVGFREPEVEELHAIARARIETEFVEALPLLILSYGENDKWPERALKRLEKDSVKRADLLRRYYGNPNRSNAGFIFVARDKIVFVDSGIGVSNCKMLYQGPPEEWVTKNLTKKKDITDASKGIVEFHYGRKPSYHAEFKVWKIDVARYRAMFGQRPAYASIVEVDHNRYRK